MAPVGGGKGSTKFLPGLLHVGHCFGFLILSLSC